MTVDRTEKPRSEARTDMPPRLPERGDREAAQPRSRGGKWLVLCLVMGLLMGLLVAGGGMYALFAKVVIPTMIAKFQEAANTPPEPTLVRVDPVKRESVADVRLVTGYIQPVRDSMIASEESGRVLVAPPDIGTVVHQGDVLAKLDTTLMEKQRAIAQADIAEAHAQMAEQQATLEQTDNLRRRYEQLVKTGGVSQTELDQAVRDQQVATAKIETAKATLAARQADLDQINERLAKMIVHAPFDGTVTQKLTEVGQWLSPGSGIAQLTDWSIVDARIDIPESIIEALPLENVDASHGPDIAVTIPSLKKTFTGKLYRVVPSGDPAARTFPALIRIDNAAGVLRPGMTVTANLATGHNMEALTAARDAVQITPTGPRVIVDREGTAAVVPVILLFTVGDRFVIRADGLNDGDLLVTEGNERLSAGTPLKIVGEHSDANPKPAEAPKSPEKTADSTP